MSSQAAKQRKPQALKTSGSENEQGGLPAAPVGQSLCLTSDVT